jgi:hypothetical protein
MGPCSVIIGKVRFQNLSIIATVAKHTSRTTSWRTTGLRRACTPCGRRESVSGSRVPSRTGCRDSSWMLPTCYRAMDTMDLGWSTLPCVFEKAPSGPRNPVKRAAQTRSWPRCGIPPRFSDAQKTASNRLWTTAPRSG